jgi:hypothetical protein
MVLRVTREGIGRAKFLIWLVTALVAISIVSGVSLAVLVGDNGNKQQSGATAVLGVQIAGPNQLSVGDTADCVLDDVKQLPNGKVKILPVCPKSFGLSGNITGLYPGAHPNLPVLVTNQNNQDIKVTQIQITVTATNKSGCTTSSTNLQPTNYTGPGFVVHANSSTTINLPITMPSTVSNACQDAIFTLSYGGSAVKP